MENSSTNATSRRPIGITIIAILLGLGAVFAIVIAIFSLIAVVSNPLAIIGFIFACIIGIVNLALAWGLWTLKQWAFGATVIVQIISIIYITLNFILNLPKNTLGATISSLLFPVIILIYLYTDKNARKALRSQ